MSLAGSARLRGPRPGRPARPHDDGQEPIVSNELFVTRRGLFMKLGILFNSAVAAILAVPIVRFLLSSVTLGRQNAYTGWVPLGRVSEFPEGETRLATFRNPFVT